MGFDSWPPTCDSCAFRAERHDYEKAAPGSHLNPLMAKFYDRTLCLKCFLEELSQAIASIKSLSAWMEERDADKADA